MFQLPDALRRVKKSVYYPGADVNVAEKSEAQPIADIKELSRVTQQSENTYFATVQQFDASVKKVEEILVNKISVAVTMGLPNMTTDRIEHALFAKQMYLSGELDFHEYILKMTNLYPDRMDHLPEDLKRRIESCQTIGAKRTN